MVRTLLHAIAGLSFWKRTAVVTLVILIVLTWVAVCVILASYL